MKTKKRIFGLFFALTLASYMGLGACVGGIQEQIPNGNGGNGGNGGVTPPPPIVTHVPDTRATIEVELPPEVTDTPDSYGISVDGGPSDAFTCGSPCQHIVPNLDPENVYTVDVTYTTSEGTSLPGQVTIDTSFKTASYTGTAGTFYGSAISLGDANGDGHDDLLVGPGYDTPTPRIVDLFLLGPDYFPAGAGDGLVPHISIEDSLVSNTAGFWSDMGDVNCDGISDLLIADPRGDLLQGTIFVFRGSSTLPPGNLDLRVENDFYLFYNVAPDSRFGYAFATGDLGAGDCDDIIIGAWNYEVITLGAVFQRNSPIDANVILDGADIIFAGTAGGDQAGIVVKNVGDVDGDGSEEVMFAASYTISALPNTWDVDFMFSDNIGVTFGTFTSYNDGSPGSRMITGGGLGPERFYISYSSDATSAVVNLYNQRASIIPENQILNGTDPTFGTGVGYGDLYPSTPEVELVIGSEDAIYVYNDFTVGAGFDITADHTLPLHGMNLKIGDFNGDGYLDIATTDLNTVYIYY